MDLDTVANFYQAVPTDWLVLGCFAILVAFDVLRAGAHRICTLALAVPIAFVFFLASERALFISSFASELSTPYMQAAFLGVLIVAAYVIIARIGLSWGAEAGLTVQASLGGVALTIILVTFWITIPALQTIWPFGLQVQEIFGESYRFWWLIGSYAALAFVRG